jgi:hypothetical protein
MPGIFGIGGPQFGLRDTKVATNDGDGTYGTAVDVPSVQLLGIQYQTVNAQLEGDDVITDTHAKAISAQMTVRFGSISLDVLEVITGKTIDESGTTPNQVRAMVFDGINFPYFAICGKSEATSGGGDTHIFVPKLKIMEGFQIQMQYGQYVIPELTAMAIGDSEYDAAPGAIFIPIEHETAANIAIPPVLP